MGDVMNMRADSMPCLETCLIRWLSIVLVAVISADAHAQNFGANSKVITWGPVQASGEAYVGILGEISKPDVYRADPNSLNLQTVIRRAGGITEEASGTIRIIRQDRVVESVYFTPQINRPLLAGDLLVVESRRMQAAVSRLYDANPRLNHEFSDATEQHRLHQGNGVQIAFVNVLDRPVVVKVKHEDASIPSLVQMLHQPVELSQAVKVIGPERMLSQPAAAQPLTTTLGDGSVLVFPRNSVDRSRLPALPPPYDSEIASGALPSLIGGPTGQSPELRNVGRLPPLTVRDQHHYQQAPANFDAVSSPAATPPIEAQAPPTAEHLSIPGPSQDSLVSSPPRIATIPFTGERRNKSSSTSTSLPPRAEQGLPDDHDFENKKSIQKSDSPKETSPLIKAQNSTPTKSDFNEDDLLDDHEGNRESSRSSFSLVSLVGISFCVLLLVGAALLTRKHLDRISDQSEPAIFQTADLMDQAPVAPLEADVADSHNNQTGSTIDEKPSSVASVEQPTSTLWIDQLLRNQLPVREEAPEFSGSIHIQGRIAAPPVYRVDGPQVAKSGPHFVQPVIEPSIADSENVIEPVDTPKVFDEFDDPHPGHPAQPHFLRRKSGMSTMATSTVARKKAGLSTIDIKLSDTPVTDALRHLQGETS